MSSDLTLTASYEDPLGYKPDPKPCSNVRNIFEYARTVLNPGRFFRIVLHLFAERKLLVFFGVHFVSTMIIWSKYTCTLLSRLCVAVQCLISSFH